MDRFTKNVSIPYGISLAMLALNLTLFIGTPYMMMIGGLGTAIWAYGYGYSRGGQY